MNSQSDRDDSSDPKKDLAATFVSHSVRDEDADKTRDSVRPSEKTQADPDDDRTIFNQPQTPSAPKSESTKVEVASDNLSEPTLASSPAFIQGTDLTLPSNVASQPTKGDFPTRDSQGLNDGKTGRSKNTARSIEKTIASRGNQSANGADDEFELLTRTKAKHDGPEKIGRYEVLRLLGEGAFGRVYEAHDPQLERRVAIKVAKAISGATQVKRFLREARAAAQLRHPNIIPVFEYGQIDNENIIVYQFVNGETLKAFIRRQPNLPLSTTIEIIRQLGEGLHYAHEQGIIHRDVKPDNVLVDSNGRPHIADFGCARSIDDDTSLTVDGSILGTPMYMSPEQASGKSNSADGRTDIWSLGVMLFEMITREKPFGGNLNDLLFAICHEDAKGLRQLRSDVPRDIETVCAKCLTRDLDRRMPSGQLLADEIARYQRGEPILSRPIGALERTWLWAKRNRAVASLLATVAATLLIATIVSGSFAYAAHREKQERAMAQLNSLQVAEASQLPAIFDTLKSSTGLILPKLNQQFKNPANKPAAQRRLRMALLHLTDDPTQRTQLVDQLYQTDLLSVEASEFEVCRDCLDGDQAALIEPLWQIALNKDLAESASRKFRASVALASFDPESENWKPQAADVADYLTSLDPVEMAQWLPAVKPVREHLQPHLIRTFEVSDPALLPSSQLAAAALAQLFVDDVTLLVDLIPRARPTQLPLLTAALQSNVQSAIELLQTRQQALMVARKQTAPSFAAAELAIKQQSNLTIALMQLGERYQWSQFQIGSDASVATQLIETLGPANTPLELLLPKMQDWRTDNDADALAGVLLALGQYAPNQILSSQREQLRPVLLEIFSDAAAARVHASARWLLCKWNLQDAMIAREQQLRRAEPEAGKNWHIDLAGNTFAIFGPVEQFQMGFDGAAIFPIGFNKDDGLDEPLHKKRIPRRFGICISEVTVAQYIKYQIAAIERWQQSLPALKRKQERLAQLIASAAAEASTEELAKNPANGALKLAPELDEKKKLDRQIAVLTNDIETAYKDLKGLQGKDSELPINNVAWYSAIAYCRWLSEQQTLDSSLPTLDRLHGLLNQATQGIDLALIETDPGKSGYRLPTASEWEFACRQQTNTLFPFGSSPTWAGQYGWTATNSGSGLHRGCQLKPGLGGLFDDLGNVGELCLDWYLEKLPDRNTDDAGEIWIDFGPEIMRQQAPNREYRGGSFKDKLFDVRSSKRGSFRPLLFQPYLGFRLARTYQ